MTLREELIKRGIKKEELSQYQSDLYVLKNNISDEFIKNYRYKSTVTTFTSQIDGKTWYDIPFGYFTEFIENKIKGG
jgi:hypothetical protein